MNACRSALLCLAVAVVASEAQAFPQRFAELRGAHLVPHGFPGLDFANDVADIDGDGDLDVLFAVGDVNDGFTTLAWLNDGEGVFTPRVLIPEPAGLPTAGDFDGDGSVDLIVVDSGAATLWLNSGGTFMRSPRSIPWYTRELTTGDLDGDGDLDAASAADGGWLWFNDGTGVFTRQTLSPTNAPATVTLLDVDGDGDLDAFLAMGPWQDPVTWIIHYTPNELWLNNGAGQFVAASSLLLTNDPTLGTTQVGAGDLDSDGRVDLVLSGDRLRVFHNTGAGWIERNSPPLSLRSESVAIADLDADGDLDLLVSAAGILAWENDGTGLFRPFPLAERWDSNSGRFWTFDADSDGDADFVTAGWTGVSPPRLYLDTGHGAPRDASAATLPAGMTNAVAAADVDSDGDLDILMGGPAYGQSREARLLLNRGDGFLVTAPPGRMPIDPNWSSLHAFADVDGDGDPDVVFVGLDLQLHLYLDNGAGSFTQTSGSFPPHGPGSEPLIGDLDGDGTVDVYLVGYRTQNQLLLNRGNGTFFDATSGLPRESASHLHGLLSDIDGDGDLDVVLATADWSGASRSVQIQRNDGNGRFTDISNQAVPPLGPCTNGVGAGDVDGDGDVDLIAGWFRMDLLLNDGQGRFTVAPGSLPPVDPDGSDFVLFDVDGDGDLDLVAAVKGSGDHWFSNDGSGVFQDEGTLQEPAKSHRYHVFDLDGDGDLDLVGEGVLSLPIPSLLTNLRTQLAVPWLTGPGRKMRLQVWSWLANPPATHWAVPLVSAASARIALPPWGVLRVDPRPGFLAVLPPIAVPSTGGPGLLDTRLPASPSLVGADLYFQALVVPPGGLGAARLTNLAIAPVLSL